MYISLSQNLALTAIMVSYSHDIFFFGFLPGGYHQNKNIPGVFYMSRVFIIFVCMRSFSWLYPGDALTPIAWGVDYRDYYLRDVLSNKGCNVAMLRLRSSVGDIRVFYEDELTTCRVVDLHSTVSLSSEEAAVLFGLGKLDRYDLVIRYYPYSENPFIPKWVSVVDADTKSPIYSI